MSDLVELVCPMCGSDLKVTKDIERFVCSSCEHEVLIQSQGDIFWAKPVIETVTQVGSNMGKVASEYAINRLKGEISDLRAYLAQFDAKLYPFREAVQKNAKVETIRNQINKRQITIVILYILKIIIIPLAVVAGCNYRGHSSFPLYVIGFSIIAAFVFHFVGSEMSDTNYRDNQVLSALRKELKESAWELGYKEFKLDEI